MYRRIEAGRQEGVTSAEHTPQIVTISVVGHGIEYTPPGGAGEVGFPMGDMYSLHPL